jgi:23S rRNA (adenine1618-N6)-methyltransferase
MHPRNRHQGRYDFAALTAAHPALTAFVAPNAYGDLSVDFANPEAVKTLNRALLASYYGLQYWDIPPGFLCPPIPGRADYIHYAADLLAASLKGGVPRGREVRVLDIGTGANAVYPIIGHGEYGWSFVGSDIDPDALASATNIFAKNPAFAGVFTPRLQTSRYRIFDGVVRPGEFFELVVCNPPFHGSAQEAAEGSTRKWRNLGKGGTAAAAPVLNFGGRGTELWCEGGEAAFIGAMISESVNIPRNVRWFTALVSRYENLPALRDAAQRAGVVDFRTIDMEQGAKKSRFVAWTYHLPEQRREQRRT